MANIEEWKRDVGPGWGIILDYTDNALEQWIPGYQIAQIKEKFGGLRYYFDFPEDFDDKYDMEDPSQVESRNTRFSNIQNFVHAMEELSTTVCEFCGKPGQAHTNKYGHMTKVVCEEHKEKK